MAAPTSVSARSYQVGFGDCLLLTFHYRQGKDRHALVDFGSTRYPYKGYRLSSISDAIREHCDGHLDLLVATHRHKDHISAFGLSGTSKALEELAPTWVIRPWPDDPDAADDASGPTRPLGASSREFAQLLAGARTFATAVEQRFGSGTLRRVADVQLPNQKAITTLDGLAASAKHTDYVAADDRLRRPSVLPGVTIDILGPPTLEQVPGLARQRRDDADEFWLQRAADLAASSIGKPTLGRTTYRQLAKPDGLGAASWLIDRLNDQTTASLLRIVRLFDDAINNTSIVMLIRAGDTTLLVSGDAQIENWSYVLRRVANPRATTLRARLADIDLYKVGHHGSRNGTPKSLFKLWETNRDADRPLTSLLSTKSGVHGHSADTAVPRSTLVNALRSLGPVLSTEDLADDTDEPWVHWHS